MPETDNLVVALCFSTQPLTQPDKRDQDSRKVVKQ